MAASLAARGFTSSKEFNEGPSGILQAFAAPGSVGAADVHAGSITIESHPPALKAFPSCGCTHSAIDTTPRLQAELPTPGDITHAEVSGPPLFRDVLIHHRPRSGQEAKFGMQGCIALALVDGEVS
jgi:2-methylcitrate dehydratase PrpD